MRDDHTPPSTSGVGSEAFLPECPPGSFGPLPLPKQLLPVDPFDTRFLPNSLQGWVADIAERTQCPIDFPAVSAIVALASVLGRKVGVRPKSKDDWLVVPNLWGVLIGRPGVRKTAPLQETTEPLRLMELASSAGHDQNLKNHSARVLVQKARMRAVHAALRSEIEAHREEAALSLAREAIEAEPTEPVRKRYVVNDTTIEKLGETLRANPNGVLVVRDELDGLLRGLDRGRQDGARAFYLEAWNGTGRFTYDRIGRGTIEIEAAIISLLGSIQPGPLVKYLGQALNGHLGDDGLLSRLQLAVWPDTALASKTVDDWPDSKARGDAYDVFERFNRLTPRDVAAQQEGKIAFLRFSPSAQPAFDAWHAELDQRLRSEEEHEALESHFLKYGSLAPSLALIIHLADHGVGPITLEALEKALGWTRYLASHARRMYSASDATEGAAARRLAERIRRNEVQDGFTLREIYRRGWTGLKRVEMDEAVEVLVDRRWLIPERVRTGGAPKIIYRLNPLLRRA